MKLKGKIIWITGASGGIGKQLATDLARKGNTLILSARNKEKLEETAAECQKFSAQTFVLPLDLGDTNSLKEKTIQAIGYKNQVDMVIHCGGISQRSLIIDTEVTVDKKLMEVDYLGAVAITKAILPHFIGNGGGYFVVVSSLMGVFGSPYRSGYAAAKHALHGFFEVLRMEHSKDNIRVCMICPGFVNTDVTRNALTGDGSLNGSQDEKTEHGLSVSAFSTRMIRAMEQEKFEAHIGGKEVLGVYVKRFFPKLFYRMILKAKVR